MKILQINKFLKNVGGAETYMFNLANALKERGHDVAFWGMHDEDNLVVDRHDSFVRKIDFNGEIGILKSLKEIPNLIYSKENRKRFQKCIKNFTPDVIHIHNFNYQLTPSFLVEAKRA